MAWIKKNSAALVAVAATVGTLVHEMAGITGSQGVIDEVEAVGAAVALLSTLAHAFVTAAAGSK